MPPRLALRRQFLLRSPHQPAQLLPHLQHRPVQHAAHSLAAPSSKHDLTSQNCIITGASGSIGLATARALVLSGANVLLVARDSTKLSSTADILRADISRHSPGKNLDASHDRVRIAAGDVADHAFWPAVLKEHGANGGRVDVLVNAAGKAQNSLLVSASPEELDGIVRTNVVGPMLASKFLAKRMRRAGKSATQGGVIVNVGSLLGKFGGRGAAAYATSKAGIVGLTRATADEFSPFGIRVNAVQPGYIDSEMTKDLPNLEAITGKIPLERLGHPSEVADAIMFLITNQYANNCVLDIDGGLSARAPW